MHQGCLAVVLHCHLPYVRHPEHEDFLEEDWFYEAVAETYVPLLGMLEELEADGVPFGITLSLSPTLCEMFANPLLGRRCARYLDRHVELAEREVAARAGTPFADAARMYRRRYSRVRDVWARGGGEGVLARFGELGRRGHVELIGSAATHAILPLLTTEEGRRAQVGAGLRNFEKHFGRRPRGFWLPECGYMPGLDELLGRFGIGYFFLDTHGLLLAEPRPPAGVFAPLQTPGGPFAFGRDVETSRQVWSAQEGYPGDPVYREFYRDLGYDAELDYLAPYLHADGARRYLGFKYHRITGRETPLHEKEPYDPVAALERAGEHARHFVGRRVEQVRKVRATTGQTPVILCPYDAELFGHWWFEGVAFLEGVLRGAARQAELASVTPGVYLREHAPAEPARGQPAWSSWGNGGYFDVWVSGANDWIYPRLQDAERTMARLAARFPDAGGPLRRALDQCARQLLLAQSSDWPFLMHTRTAGDYPARRFSDLIERFEALAADLVDGRPDVRLLNRLEALDDPFPEMNYRAFGSGAQGRSQARQDD